MTILPKKKHQESRKSEQDQDIENRNRTRTRPRETRNRAPPTDDLDAAALETSSNALSLPVYNDLDTRDSQEGPSLPHKRNRHKPAQGFFLPPSNSPTVNNTHSRSGSRETSVSPSREADQDGYNSSDEHGPRSFGAKDATVEMLSEREAEFERQLSEKKGYVIKQMATDGACLFRAVADQVYGDQEMHSVVRQHCMDYMVKNRDFFSQYITEDFASYIRRKRNEHSHGNHIEIQALSEMYNRTIEVYQYSYEPINTFHSHSCNNEDYQPIRLSYHGNVHYNSVIDPYNPAVGVGLGLAGYKPGFDNKNLLKKGLQESEADLLEQEMLEDKIKATDWEATDEQLAEIAARESYLQYLKDKQKLTSNAGSSSSTSTSTQSRKSPSRRSPPHETGSTRRSPARDVKRSPPPDMYTRNGNHSGPLNKHLKGNSPRPTSSQNSYSAVMGEGSNRLKSPVGGAQASASNDWSSALGYDADWDNDPILAAVLAQSQQEYLDSLCKNNCRKSDDDKKATDSS